MEEANEFPGRPTSHFLALPAELRLQIYGYLLAGNTLHSGTPGSRSDALRNKINVCAMTEADASSPMHNQQIHAFEPVAKRPHQCCTRSTLRPGLLRMPPLLLVSQQVSRESIGVLLGENTFTFHGPQALEDFLSRLPSRDHALIRHVRFYTLTAYDPVWTSQLDLSRLLPGLTHVHAWLAISPRGMKRLRPRDMAPNETLASLEYQDRLFEYLDTFQEHGLGSARIEIDASDDIFELGTVSDIDKDCIDAWAERVQRRLMNPRQRMPDG